MKDDEMQSFIFKDRAVRGNFVRLRESYQTIINQHHYPEMLGKLLGEALLGVCLMFPFFKTQGKITLQFQGEGDLRLLSVRMTSERKIRGLLRAEPHLVSPQNLQKAFQAGQLTLTYESALGEPYQSIIPLEQASIATTLEDYFMRSEQLPTRFFLVSTGECVAGLMLQVLPSVEDDQAYQDFEHCSILAGTLKPEELLKLDLKVMLQRLFVEDDITLLGEQSIEFGCGCSRERMERVVKSLGPAEAAAILAEYGFVEVVCEFCSQAQQFNADEMQALFAGKPGLQGSGQQSSRPHFDA